MTSSLLLQLLIILVAVRLCGIALRKFDQPAVVGEMLAGVVLGPVVLGALFPALHSAAFGAQRLAGLESLASVGLVVFMFIVGAELRAPNGVLLQARTTAYVSAFSFLIPMLLGMAIAPALYPELAGPGVRFWPFTLFVATAMAVTAFPVMARILRDRNIATTRVGRTSLSSAAVVDACAWIMLAWVIAGIGSGERGSSNGLGAVVALSALTVAAICVVKPILARLLRRYSLEGKAGGATLAALLSGALACAALTEWVGLHAAFGAFLFGACLPHDDRMLGVLIERLEHLTVVLLMPIFFALAGLRTTADAFSGPGIYLLALISIVAVVGKVVSGAIGARLGGHGWREGFAVGSLMNARGLMELVVIRIGLDVGVIGEALFTMLFITAIFTTALTGPLLTLFSRRDIVDQADPAYPAKPKQGN